MLRQNLDREIPEGDRLDTPELAVGYQGRASSATSIATSTRTILCSMAGIKT